MRIAFGISIAAYDNELLIYYIIYVHTYVYRRIRIEEVYSTMFNTIFICSTCFSLLFFQFLINSKETQHS